MAATFSDTDFRGARQVPQHPYVHLGTNGFNRSGRPKKIPHDYTQRRHRVDVGFLQSPSCSYVSISVTSCRSVACLVALFRQFEWNEFAFFYSARRSELIPRCGLIQSSIDVRV